MLAAMAAIVVSLIAFVAALVGGGMLAAFAGLFSLFGLGTDMGLSSYPLGAGVFVIYVLGAALGWAGTRWPVAAGLAMLPLGACAYFFGGPIAKVFAIGIVLTGGLLLATVLRPSKT